MRHDNIKLVITIFFYLILLVSVLLLIFFYRSIPTLEVSTKALDIYMFWSYGLFGLTVLVSFVLVPIFGFIQNPKAGLKTLVAALVLAAVLGISYAMASPVPTPDTNVEVSAQAWMLADTLIYSMYILAGLGFLAIIFSELKELFH